MHNPVSDPTFVAQTPKSNNKVVLIVVGVVVACCLCLGLIGTVLIFAEMLVEILN
jgi:hypothetical protein